MVDQQAGPVRASGEESSAGGGGHRWLVLSLANGLSQSPGMLIAGRAVQGLGAALISPAVLSVIVGTFTRDHERAKALGVFSTVTAVGSASGLLLR